MRDDDAAPDPVSIPERGDERSTLVAFVEYLREALERKTDGFDHEALGRTLAPADLTLGGMLTHLAFVEDYWFGYVFRGSEPPEPWRSAP